MEVGDEGGYILVRYAVTTRISIKMGSDESRVILMFD